MDNIEVRLTRSWLPSVGWVSENEVSLTPPDESPIQIKHPDLIFFFNNNYVKYINSMPRMQKKKNLQNIE
jgi:hypothetical protein